jgi:DNA-binding SARP family transcriptional activator
LEGTLEFAILGPLHVEDAGRPYPIGSFKLAVVLGLLLCRANSVVSVVELGDALWGAAPPRTAHKNIQVYASALRRMLGQDQRASLEHRRPGYVLRIGSEQLDVLRFQQLVQGGRRAARGGNAVEADELLAAASRLWRGPVLPELGSVSMIAAEARHLREQYLAGYEDWVEARLLLGQHLQVTEEIGDLVREHPFRERLRHAQMLALYRSGRQVEALAQFDDMRQRLARELGLQPSPVLARLYEAILTGDETVAVRHASGLAPAGVRTASGKHSRLVRDVADFTGRAEEVAAVVASLDLAASGGVTVVSGAPGVGKTALAVHCLHRLGGRFQAGRILVSLRSADGSARADADLLGDLLRGTGATGVLPDDRDALATRLRESAPGKGILFVLDDAVSEEQVRSILPDLGDAPVLITSRRCLGGLDSAVHLRLEPLPEADATALLGRIIGVGRLAADPAATRRLVRICAGLPLLVRIVGAKLGMLDHLSLAAYADRLGDDRRRLDELVAGDLQVGARLAGWYRDLPAADQAAVRGLAAMPEGECTASELAGVLGTDAAAAERAIERLIEAHLAQVRGAEVEAHVLRRGLGYALNPLMRLFLAQQATSR